MKPHDEQDRAAGGAHRRSLVLVDGLKATGSIGFLAARSGSCSYAYLRFKSGGRNLKRYIGSVTAGSREEMLAMAWQLVREKKVVEISGWRWESKVRTLTKRASNRA